MSISLGCFWTYVSSHGRCLFQVTYSKCYEIDNSNQVIRSAFADYGLCNKIVSDNGPPFVSSVFKESLKKNGVRHITSAPYHPKTNGLAERFVQTLKQALKSAKKDHGTIETKVSRFLLQYRNSEHSTTKETHARLFLGRNTCTRLDKVKPNLREGVQNNSQRWYDQNVRDSSI